MSLPWAASSSASAAPIMKLSSVARWRWDFLTVCAKLPRAHKYLIKTGHLSTNNDPRDGWGWRKEESSTRRPMGREWTLGFGGMIYWDHKMVWKWGATQGRCCTYEAKHYLLIGTTCLQIYSIHVANPQGWDAWTRSYRNRAAKQPGRPR